MGGKRSFVLYFDIREPLELLSDEDRGRLFLALLDYAEHGKIPDLHGGAKMAFAFIRSAIDRDAAAWEDKRAKRAESGRLGGLAKVAKAKSAKQNQANQAVPVPVPVLVPAPVPVKEDIGADKPPRAARFTPPTVEEVAVYCAERGNAVDAQAFVDHYSANGWMRGKNKIRDWKACVRTWERNSRQGDIVSPRRYVKDGRSL